VVKSAQAQANQGKKLLDAVKKEGEDEIRRDKKSARIQPYTAQYTRLCKVYVDAMKEHQRAKESLRKTQVDGVVRQGMALPQNENKSEAEVRREVEAAGPAAFLQSALMEEASDEAQAAYMDAESRAKDIDLLMRSINEVAALFQDLAVLVQAQSAQLDTIEVHVETAQKHIRKGNDAVRYAARRPLDLPPPHSPTRQRPHPPGLPSTLHRPPPPNAAEGHHRVPKEEPQVLLLHDLRPRDYHPRGLRRARGGSDEKGLKNRCFPFFTPAALLVWPLPSLFHACRPFGVAPPRPLRKVRNPLRAAPRGCLQLVRAQLAARQRTVGTRPTPETAKREPVRNMPGEPNKTGFFAPKSLLPRQKPLCPVRQYNFSYIIRPRGAAQSSCCSQASTSSRVPKSVFVENALMMPTTPQCTSSTAPPLIPCSTLPCSMPKEDCARVRGSDPPPGAAHFAVTGPRDTAMLEDSTCMAKSSCTESVGG
jgi:hypothetical protein